MSELAQGLLQAIVLNMVLRELGVFLFIQIAYFCHFYLLKILTTG